MHIYDPVSYETLSDEQKKNDGKLEEIHQIQIRKVYTSNAKPLLFDCFVRDPVDMAQRAKELLFCFNTLSLSLSLSLFLFCAPLFLKM